MTHLQIIITLWTICACIAFFVMLNEVEDDKQAKELIEDNPIFSPAFIKKLMYILMFVYCFLLWWIVIPKAVFQWIKFRIVAFLVMKIIRLSGKGKEQEMENTLKTLKKISGNGQEDSDNI